MKISIAVINGEIVARWLGELPNKITPALVSALNEYVVKLSTHIRFQKLSGQILHKRTGRLRENILPIFAKSGGGLIWAGIGTNVVYARIHEFGGVTHPTVTSRMKKFAWYKFMESKDIMWKAIALTKKNKLTVLIPARPYIHPSFEETQDQLVAGLEKAIAESLKE